LFPASINSARIRRRSSSLNRLIVRGDVPIRNNSHEFS
jgi:hypothetical protein